MFKQLFQSMHELLDEIARDYPKASGLKKTVLEEKLSLLKKMSDTFVEEWLLFEEKMGKVIGAESKSGVDIDSEWRQTDDFQRGQGYYQLLMYDRAIDELKAVTKSHPDFLLARVYLAFGYLRTGNYGESYRHFQFILSLTNHLKIKAISYNAMGCIQMNNNNLDEAYEYFKKAYETDPGSVEPLLSLLES